MFDTLLSNLMLIGILVCMYLGSLVLNTILGVYHNVADLKNEFSKEKMISGLVKGAIVLVGSLGIAAMVSLLPELLAAFGIAADSALLEGISIAAIGGVMVSSIVKYIGDAIKKLYVILGYVKSEE